MNIANEDKEKKECLHDFKFTFVIDWVDLTCKKCKKDIFSLYKKKDALELYDLHKNNLKR